MYAIKAAIADLRARVFEFRAQKTMYGGRKVAVGDTIFVFDREEGLIARGVVTAARALPRKPAVERQTPLVSITVRRTALARKRLGRTELKPHAHWDDGRPETELNFKFYRQATNKVVDISAATAAFLSRYF